VHTIGRNSPRRVARELSLSLCLLSAALLAVCPGATAGNASETFQTASRRNPEQIFVLGSDGKLWLERAPFGAIPPDRVQIDATAVAFQPLVDQAVLVLGTDRKLWLEHGPFGSIPPARELVDTSVQDFEAVDDQSVLVLGTDGKLWLERGPFDPARPARTQVDATVRSFKIVDSQNVLVLGSDGKLWLERSPFGTVPPARVQIDAEVQDYQFLDDRTVLVLATIGSYGLNARRSARSRPRERRSMRLCTRSALFTISSLSSLARTASYGWSAAPLAPCRPAGIRWMTTYTPSKVSARALFWFWEPMANCGSNANRLEKCRRRASWSTPT
jgi:hypothetical protein